MKTIKECINIKIIGFSFILLSFQSCKKEGPTHIITGILFEDCNLQPVANQKINLFQEYESGFLGQSGGVLDETITDSNGNFKFEFKDKGGSTESIRIPAGYGYTRLLERIPQNKSINDLKVYKSTTTNIRVNLIVNNSYSNLDTLLLTNFNKLSTPYKLAGPFTSGLLYESIEFKILNYSYNKNILNFGYKLNSNSEVISSPTITTCGITNIDLVIN